MGRRHDARVCHAGERRYLGTATVDSTFKAGVDRIILDGLDIIATTAAFGSVNAVDDELGVWLAPRLGR